MKNKSDLNGVFAAHAKTTLSGIIPSLLERQVRFALVPVEIHKRIGEPAWQLMPLAIRLLGPDRFRWNDLVALVARNSLEQKGQSVVGRLDWQTALNLTVDQFTGANTVVAKQKQTATPESAPQPKPSQSEFLGIDLGTTYSAVAYIDKRGRPTSIPNLDGEILTPSVVFFDDNGPIVGKSAIQAGLVEPNKVADCVKRDMGENSYRKPIAGNFLPPEVISSFILRRPFAVRPLGSGSGLHPRLHPEIAGGTFQRYSGELSHS